MTAAKPGKRKGSNASITTPSPPNNKKSARKSAQQTSLGSFFRPKNADADGAVEFKPCLTPFSLIEWREFESTWIGTFKKPEPSTKFAAFDLDKTLIEVRGHWKFPKDANDWRFFHPQVPQVLQRMYNQGYKIVIISNQAGLRPAKGSTELTKTAKEFRRKIDNIAKQFDFPFTILAATGRNYMRKPSPGMWFMAEMDNGGVEVDRKASFFVGDAAGRPAGWKQGALEDFSDSDLAFALNAGVPFYTPEEIFNEDICSKEQPLPLAAPNVWLIDRFHSKALAIDHDGHTKLLKSIEELAGLAQSQGKGMLVVLVGPPASGKSTFANTHLSKLGFERANMDTLKTRKKCMDAVKVALESSKLVVVDNTNPDIASRSSFLHIASKAGVSCVAVVFENSTRDLTTHNNLFRSQLRQARYMAGPMESKKLHLIPSIWESVPAVAFNTYFKRFVAPTEEEGFAKVFRHVFVPVFCPPTDEALWHQYY
ncbi:DNA kinase/phosphatase Pnk1 [Coemansia interrupta]|uniref:DNA kinase/phosphatase Pnk1 n=1 Tax=Coemansia interrupta TaxID=1126814 RepID=A0A9W8H5G5_9FUNG|nr:DNA kinase/phosphatase Pnk1 [Coemansia interrupta]